MEKKSVELAPAHAAAVIQALSGAQSRLQGVVTALAAAGQIGSATHARICELRDEVGAMSRGANPTLFL